VDIFNSLLPISPYLIWRLARYIRKHGFNLLQTNLIHADVWGACVKFFFLPKLHLISVKHGYSDSFQSLYGLNPANLKLDLMALLTRWAGRYADKVVCISFALESFMVTGKLIDKDKALTIPYGFDFSKAYSAVEVGGVRFGTPQIVMVGRLVPVKQHKLLIKIVPNLVEEFPKLSVVMVGAGPLQDDLRRLTDELDLSDHIHWEGFKDNMHDYIRDSDVMVVPSVAEGFGMVVLEAWHHSKAVVAFDVPAINEIVDSGVDGELISPFDVQHLTEVLKKLLREPYRRQELGVAGQKKQLMIYGINNMCYRMISLFLQESNDKIL
jgi:glycosyltransferase involved in cell wall biosynthesis